MPKQAKPLKLPQACIAPFSWDASQDRLISAAEAREKFKAGELWRVGAYRGLPTYCFPHDAARARMSSSSIPAWFYKLPRAEANV